MFVPKEEIELITGKAKRRSMWLPITRGTVNQVQACPVELGQCVRLQPHVGAKSTAITITEHPLLTTLGLMTATDARHLGYSSLQGALDAWRLSYGPPGDDVPLWVVRFIRGDRSGFYRARAEKYLKAKMGGARAYTTLPELGVFGEGAVPDADLASFAGDAFHDREDAAEAETKATLKTILKAIKSLEAHDISADTRKEIAWMRRRAEKLREKLHA